LSRKRNIANPVTKYTPQPMSVRPNVLAIAGSDSSGCSGVQADLKALAACGVHSLSVITAVTAQTTRRVESIHRVPAAQVAAQLRAVFADFHIAAVKIGMLASADNIDAVADGLRIDAARNIVIDPVLVSSSGTRLLPARALDRLRHALFPLATLLTPNVPEAETLLGRRLRGPTDLVGAAQDLLATGARAILLKGGHLRGPRIRDVLVDGESVTEFEHARLPAAARGTGCTLASAIAAGLARRMELRQAVQEAERFLQAAMRGAYRPGRGKRRALDPSAGNVNTF
jgi:hydroxymethylpyrimidine/phosphomethylpyrimidine kinase